MSGRTRPAYLSKILIALCTNTGSYMYTFIIVLKWLYHLPLAIINQIQNNTTTKYNLSA